MRRPRGPTQSEEIHENGNEKDATEISQEDQQDYDLDGSQAPRRSRNLIFNPARRNGRDGLNLRGRHRDGGGPFFADPSASIAAVVRTRCYRDDLYHRNPDRGDVQPAVARARRRHSSPD